MNISIKEHPKSFSLTLVSNSLADASMVTRLGVLNNGRVIISPAIIGLNGDFGLTVKFPKRRNRAQSIASEVEKDQTLLLGPTPKEEKE